MLGHLALERDNELIQRLRSLETERVAGELDEDGVPTHVLEDGLHVLQDGLESPLALVQVRIRDLEDVAGQLDARQRFGSGVSPIRAHVV